MIFLGFDTSSNKFVGLPLQWTSIVKDQAGANSPHRPHPVVDPNSFTPTGRIIYWIDQCYKITLSFSVSIFTFVKGIFSLLIINIMHSYLHKKICINIRLHIFILTLGIKWKQLKYCNLRIQFQCILQSQII